MGQEAVSGVSGRGRIAGKASVGSAGGSGWAFRRGRGLAERRGQVWSGGCGWASGRGQVCAERWEWVQSGRSGFWRGRGLPGRRRRVRSGECGRAFPARPGLPERWKWFGLEVVAGLSGAAGARRGDEDGFGQEVVVEPSGAAGVCQGGEGRFGRASAAVLSRRGRSSPERRESVRPGDCGWSFLRMAAGSSPLIHRRVGWRPGSASPRAVRPRFAGHLAERPLRWETGDGAGLVRLDWFVRNARRWALARRSGPEPG